MMDTQTAPAQRYAVSLEWLCDEVAIARVHPDPAGLLGDPYEWFTVIHRKADVAHVRGADRPMPPGSGVPFCDALRDAGFKARSHTRLKNGEVRTVVKTL